MARPGTHEVIILSIKQQGGNMKPLPKPIITHLHGMMIHLDKLEAGFQRHSGDAWPGSKRAAKKRDADCLRAVLAQDAEIRESERAKIYKKEGKK